MCLGTDDVLHYCLLSVSSGCRRMTPKSCCLGVPALQHRSKAQAFEYTTL